MSAESSEAGKRGKRGTRPPNDDMQAEDAGTRRSGQPRATVRGTAASSATKQESKTGKESGSRGRG